jgi:hypothetical protein
MYSIVAQLGAFDSFKQYGQLIARLGGAAIDQLSTLIACVTDGLATSDFASIGTCAGKVVMILFDSSL